VCVREREREREKFIDNQIDDSRSVSTSEEKGPVGWGEGRVEKRRSLEELRWHLLRVLRPSQTY